MTQTMKLNCLWLAVLLASCGMANGKHALVMNEPEASPTPVIDIPPDSSPSDSDQMSGEPMPTPEETSEPGPIESPTPGEEPTPTATPDEETPKPHPTHSATPKPTATVAPTPSPTPIVSFYGPGLTADALGHLNVGGTQGNAKRQVSLRFKAKKTGQIQKFRTHVIWDKTRAGYSAGTGGTLQFGLYKDDDSSKHQPTGNALATATFASPIASNDPYKQLSWSSPVMVEEGKLYHVVVSNSDASPTANFVSINGVSSGTTSPRHPTLSDESWAMLYKDSAWTEHPSYVPILELTYLDSSAFGVGVVDVWSTSSKAISGTAKVRQIFTVSESSRDVMSVGVRVKRVSGSDALTVRIESADGTLVDEKSIPAATVPQQMGWVEVTFAAPIFLAQGQTFNLVLVAPATSKYETYPTRQGSAYGFTAQSFFGDGYAQFNPGTGWTGWDYASTSDRRDGDLPFYFKIED